MRYSDLPGPGDFWCQEPGWRGEFDHAPPAGPALVPFRDPLCEMAEARKHYVMQRRAHPRLTDEQGNHPYLVHRRRAIRIASGFRDMDTLAMLIVGPRVLHAWRAAA